MANTSSWPLVGRERELATVGEVMDQRSDGGAGGVLLAGPAGVGKTRLATECLGLAEARGWSTAQVRANRSAATIPFGAFAPMLPATVSTPDGRTEALRRATAAVVESAGDRHLMLLVDDAHDLDDASAALLHLLAGSDRVFPVVTVRSGEAAPEPVTALWKDELLVRIDVPELSPEDAADLVIGALGGEVDGGTLRALWSTSGGNALFLRELLIGARDAGTLQEAGGLWRLRGALSPSTRLGEVVGLRLGSLGDAERHTLEVVSIGEPVSLADLGELADPDSIDDLERRGLLDVVTERRRQQVRIAHPLYSEVVRAGLPARRRQEICRALAERVAARGPHRREDTLRVAIWQLDSGGPGSPDLMLEGAHQARFAFDFRLAERLARVAWETEPSAAIGHVLGETLDMLGRHEEAEDVLRVAEAAVVDDHDRALVALARSANLFRGLGRAAEAEAVARAAERDVRDGALRDELVGQRAIHTLFEGRLDEAMALVEPLLGRDVEDRAFVRGALPGATARALAGRTEEAIAIADRAFAARVALGDQVQMAGPGVYLVARALALLEAGRCAEAETNAQLGYDGAAEYQLLDGQAWFAVILGRICLQQGRAAASARWFREAALIYGELNHPAARWGQGGLAHALALIGDTDGAEAALADFDAEPPTPLRMMDPDIERGRAWFLAQRGELSMARSVLHGAADSAAVGGAHALEVAALHDLARLGGTDLVVDRFHSLASVVDGALMAARVVHVDALVSLAPDAFDAAADGFEAIGANLLAAEAAASAGRAYKLAGLSRRATESAQRSARLAAACEGARTPALKAGSEATPLTRREREVAELAARGATSRDIAEKLFVSSRTVENHLQRSYEKLGVRGRADLADALGIEAD
jgi:DNA-binding CsgD family transcriptional regulator